MDLLRHRLRQCALLPLTVFFYFHYNDLRADEKQNLSCAANNRPGRFAAGSMTGVGDAGQPSRRHLRRQYFMV
jgi:hypothetical protein